MLNPLITRFASVPALIAPEMADRFHASLEAMATLEDLPKMLATQASNDDNFWPAPDHWMARYRPYTVVNGVLQIPVKGMLLRDFPFQVGAWATGYTYVLRAWQRGIEDGGVRGIAYIVDSPGGEVAECFDVVDKLFAGRGTKPARAFVSESAYSAAYAIASVADSIIVSRTGGVGSIGVFTTHFDVSQAMEKGGYKITFIHAGKHKVEGNSFEPLPADVKARIQKRIDSIYSVFVASVARNRSMDEQVVRDTEALTFTAAEAVSNGLADSVGVLDDSLAVYAADLSHTDGEDQMSGSKDEAAANQAAVDQARAEGVASGKAEGITEGTKAGAVAERTRITTILGSEEGKKRPKAAFSAAINTDMTAEAASKFLAALPEEKAAATDPEAGHESSFERVMNATDQPELGAGKPGEQGKGTTSDDIMASAGFAKK